MSISAALGNPAGRSIVSFTIGRVLPGVLAGAVAPPLVAPLLVAGGIFAAQAAWYYWSEQNQKSIIAKATKNYCAGNPGSAACPSQAGTLTYGFPHSSGRIDYYGAFQIGGIPRPAEYMYFTSYDTYVDNGQQEMYKNRIRLYRTDGTNSDGAYVPGTIDFQSFSSGISWDKLSQAERDQIISALTDADWRDEIGKMLQGGALTDGQILNSPAMLLDNAREIPANSRVLNPSDAAVVEAVMDRMRPLQDKVDDLAKIIAAAGLVGVGASVAANTGAISNLGDTVRRASEATNTKVDAMQATMNDNFNEVKKRFKSITSFLNFDRILNILIWVNTLHNAFMLSADLARSLLSMFSTALKALPGDSVLGLPTESADGSPIDLATKVNSSIEAWVKGAIGAQNYAQMQVSLASINRIYQSGINGVNHLQSIMQSGISMTQLVGERVARVGNALTRFGVVDDNAYNRMSENMNTRTAWFDRLQERISNTQDVVSSVEQIMGSVISIQDSVTQLKQERKTIETELNNLDKIIEPDNKAVKELLDKENTSSQSSSISTDDLKKPVPIE